MQYTQHKTSSTLVLCCVLHNWHNRWSYIYCKHSFKILVNLTSNMVTDSFEWVDIHCRMNKVLLWIFLSSKDRFNVYTKEFEVKFLVGASWSLNMTEWVTVYLIPIKDIFSQNDHYWSCHACAWVVRATYFGCHSAAVITRSHFEVIKHEHLILYSH